MGSRAKSYTVPLVNGACSFIHNAGNSYCFLCTCTTAGPIIASFKVRIHAMQDLALFHVWKPTQSRLVVVKMITDNELIKLEVCSSPPTSCFMGQPTLYIFLV